jgi:hypothetical protein
MQFFDHKDEVAIQEAMKDHRETHNCEFDASELFKQIKKIPPIGQHWMFMSPAAIIAITFAIMFVLFCCWKKACFNKRSASNITGLVGTTSATSSSASLHT